MAFNFDAVREKLLTLIAEQRTMSEIGRALGTSSNSVSGYLHRNPELSPLRKPQAPAKDRTSFNGASNATRQAPKSITLTKVAVEARRVPLLAIAARGQCRWPVEDDPAMPHGIICCGGPTVGDSVYCASHHALAYVKPRAQGSALIRTGKPKVSEAETTEKVTEIGTGRSI